MLERVQHVLYMCCYFHPEAYPKNVVLARLAKAGKYKSKRNINRYNKVGGAEHGTRQRRIIR